MTTEEIKLELENQEKIIDDLFVEEINQIVKKYARNLVAVPILVPDVNGMKIAAQITIQRNP